MTQTQPTASRSISWSRVAVSSARDVGRRRPKAPCASPPPAPPRSPPSAPRRSRRPRVSLLPAAKVPSRSLASLPRSSIANCGLSNFLTRCCEPPPVRGHTLENQKSRLNQIIARPFLQIALTRPSHSDNKQRRDSHYETA